MRGYFTFRDIIEKKKILEKKHLTPFREKEYKNVLKIQLLCSHKINLCVLFDADLMHIFVGYIHTYTYT